MTAELIEWGVDSPRHQMALKGIPYSEIARFLIDDTSARAAVEVLLELARERGDC